MFKKIYNVFFLEGDFFPVYIYKKVKNNNEYYNIFKNFLSLSSVQVLSYIFPVIVFPYIVKTLGPSKYGLLAFAQSIVSYFMIILGYGFDIVAMRDISIYRNDRKKLSEIFTAIVWLKLTFFIFLFFIYYLIITGFNKFHDYKLFYLLSFFVLISEIIPYFIIFQGLEKLKYVTVVTFLIRFLNLILIFLFIRKESDYIIYPVISTVVNLISAIIYFGIITLKFGIKLEKPNIDKMGLYIKEGFDIFISNVFVYLYKYSTTFFLGVFTDMRTVGYYAVAEKIIRIINAFYSVISTVVLPHIIYRFSKSVKSGKRFICRLLKIIMPLVVIISAVIFFSSDYIIKFLLHSKNSLSINLLKIMSFLPLIFVISNIFGVQGLLSGGYDREYKRTVVFASVMSIFGSLIFVPLFKAYATVSILVITEVFIALSFYVKFNLLYKE